MLKTLRPRTLRLRIRASRREVEEALQGVCHRTPYSLFGSPRPFRGRVEDGAFRLTLNEGRNSFRPVVSGRLEEEPGGTVLLRAVLRPFVSVLVFFGIWFGMLALFIPGTLQLYLEGGSVAPLLAMSGIGVFGVAFLLLGFLRIYPSKVESTIARLIEAFSEFEVEPLPEEECADASTDSPRPPETPSPPG